MNIRKTSIAVLLAFSSILAGAQQTLTLEECRHLALQNSKELQQSSINMDMARYDRGIARANYFPKVSATGLYSYNNKGIALISDDEAAALMNLGTAAQAGVTNATQGFIEQVMSNPLAIQEYMGSPMWQTLTKTLSAIDISAPLNNIAEKVNEALRPDITNIYAGIVTVEQPIFAGGKIVASNKMAALAEELSSAQYVTEQDKTILDTDHAYWQIVSLSAKKKLADSYCALLDQMVHDASIAVSAGTATESDLLSVKVKANEAHLMVTKAANGLKLSRMLLCKQIGLPLESDVVLADENKDGLADTQGVHLAYKTLDEVLESRSEIKSLDLATKIYDQKVKVARADYLPQLGVMANYLVTNPNINNGIANSFGDRFSAGLILKVPIFHGMEGAQRVKKSKAEANLMRSRYDDACEKISLQVTQQQCRYEEALERAESTRGCLDSAEENLRTAMIGYEAGVVPSSTTLAAQSAWLQAHSEYIDAGISLMIAQSELLAAQGELTIN